MFKGRVNGASRDRVYRASSACVACPEGSPLPPIYTFPAVDSDGATFLVHTIILATAPSMISLGKGKGIPITGHKGPRGMWMQGCTYTQPLH